MPYDTTSDSWIIFEFTDRWLDDRKRGGAHDVEHYLALYPGHEEAIRREHAELSRSYATRSERAERGSDVPPGMHRLGPYRLLRELGSGGQARVWLAEDTQLGRKVALKVLGAMLVGASQTRRERFRREAELVARLEHPGLCAVLDADLDGELPWIAMRYVEGETLSACLERERDEWERACAAGAPHTIHGTRLAERLWFFERVARALHAAHEAGVVHRDVKPGNVMLTTDGSPVLLDFGLAYDEDDHGAITRTGEVFGTPAYMAPEQLDGAPTDRRTDIYGLGVVLYEALTLQRPHSGSSSEALARSIRQEIPPDPHVLNPRLPRDLSVVLATAMEKEPGRRYATALDLAEELRRVREYEPILARPVGPIGRLARWMRRKPVLASATLGSIAVLSIALLASLMFIQELRDQRNATERALGEKQEALSLFEGAWYRDLSANRVAVSPPEALRLAIAAAERDPGLASNQAMLVALEGLYERTTLIGHRSTITEVDVDRVQGRIVTSGQDGTARVWDPTTGACLAVLQEGDAKVWCARFDSRGERIVSASADGIGRIWSVADPAARPIELEGHEADVCWAEFSSDGERVVTASRDHTARVWNARTGQLQHVLTGHRGNVSEAHFIDSDRRIVTASGEPPLASAEPESDDTLRVYDVASGACEAILTEHTGVLRSIAIHPDGRRFVSTAEDGTARLWDLGRIVPGAIAQPLASTHVMKVTGYLAAASFHPDGKRLAIAGEEGARVVDVDTFETVYELPNHDHRAIIDIEYEPHGLYLATAAFDNTVRVFQGSSPEQVTLCRGVPVRPRGVRWAADGSWLVSWHTTNDAMVWYGRERPFLSVLDARAGALTTARFSPSGGQIVAACADGRAALFDTATSVLVRRLDPEPSSSTRSPLSSADFDATGRRVLVRAADGRVTVMRTENGTIEGRFTSAANGPEPRFLSGGERIFLVGRDGQAAIVFLDGREAIRLSGQRGRVVAACVSPDEGTLVCGSDDRTVHSWRIADAQAGATLPCSWTFGPFEIANHRLTSIYDVTMSRDGHRVAAVTQNMTTVLLDGASGHELGEQRTATAGRAAFDASGSTLFTTGKWTGFARVYLMPEGETGNALAPIELRDPRAWMKNGSYTCLASSERGSWMLAGSLDRTAKLWDASTLSCLAVYAGHTDAVWDVDFSPDQKRFVTASGDGTARIWPIDVLTTARQYLPESAMAPNLVPKLPARTH